MTRSTRLGLALGLNVLLVLGEAAGGLAGRSTGLLADAVHNLTDAAGLLLALVAVRFALRSPTGKRSFGYHRATILTALANAGAVVAAIVLIVVEAARRIAHPVPIHAGTVVVVAAVSLVLNGFAVLLMHDRSHDLNMRAGMMHMAGDAAASLGVLAAGAVILATGRLELLDPAVSLGIALLVAVKAWGLARESVDVLLESTPADVDLASLGASVLATPGVAGVHDVHCWSLSSEVRALSAHVVLTGHPTLEQAQVVGERVKKGLFTDWRIAHATLELECEACVDDTSDACNIDGRPPAGASRARALRPRSAAGTPGG